ncbi:PAS domain S-box protein [bacterium]|nr:PAS domain S-box protein [bacterium]
MTTDGSRDILDGDGQAALLRLLVERSPHGVFLVDDTGRYLYVNAAACQMTGRDRDDLLSRSIFEMRAAPGSVAGDSDHFEHLRREGHAVGEMPYIHADGSRRWWRVEAVRIEDGLYAGFTTDVTDRHELVEQLRRERSRFERAQGLSNVGWWEIDLETGRVLASDEIHDIYGVPRGAPVDLALAQSLVAPEDRPALDEALDDLLGGRRPYDVTYTVIQRDSGARRRVRSRAEYDSERRTVFGVLTDVTEYTGALEAASRREAQLRAIFDSAGDFIYLKDRDLRYTHANRAATDYLGRSHEEVVGCTDFDLFPPEVAEEIRTTDRQVLAGQRDRGRFVRRQGGEERVLETVKVPMHDEDGEVVGLCGVTRDITELRRLEEQLRQAQKMEAVGRLAGGLAHDFNNLLTPILGYTALASEALAQDHPLQHDLGAIDRAAVRARDLTANLLAFSRKQVLDRRVVSLNDIIQEMEDMLRRLLREDVTVRCRLAPDLGVVRGDVAQLHNVLINLAVNAADAMPDGGLLTIETQNVELGEEYLRDHQEAQGGPHVLLAVTDTGRGMDPETRQRVFEPFFTTKPVDEGTGLGLATVHGIVKQHGGSIEVYSELDHGTTFKVYLPRVEGVAAETEHHAPTDHLEGDERLLVVEDDEAVRQLATAVLVKAGYEVVAVDSPSAVLRMLEHELEPFALLVTDVVMPGMNGAQLHRALTDVWPDLPALYMSGYTSNVIAHHGVLAEGLKFIQKPFLPVELLRRVREILDE